MTIVRGSAKEEMCNHIAEAIMVMKSDIERHHLEKLLGYVWDIAQIDCYAEKKVKQ